MRSTHGRRYAAAVLALGVLALGPGVTAASATDATITTDAGLYAIGEPMLATGSCGAEALTAVVRVTQSGETVSEQAADVDNGRFEATNALRGTAPGPAVVAVDCLAYGASAPLGSDQVQVHLLPPEGQDHVAVDVAITPAKATVGDTVTIGASCPAGTTEALVQVGNSSADQVFLTRTVTPDDEGKVAVAARLEEAGGVEPEAGAAVAVVECGDPADLPTRVAFGVGMAGVDLVVDGGAVSDGTAGRSGGDGAVAASGPRHLPVTGSDIGELVMTAVALLAAGLAVGLISRRNRRI